MDDWARKRIQELEASAPTKRKRAEPFARIPLPAAAQAAIATRCGKLMVWIWLLHRSWRDRSMTVPVPNGALTKYGVSRRVKYLALSQLEDAGMITVDRRSRKTVVVTLHHN
jgi:hypothetical protein